MKYTITTLPLADEKKAKLLARAMQSKAAGLSFLELTELVQSEEFKIGSGIPAAQADQLKHQLDEIGVKYRVEKELEPELAPRPVPEEIAPRAVETPKAVQEQRLPPLHTTVIERPRRSKLVIPMTVVTIIATGFLLFLLMESAENRREFKMNELSLTDTTESGAPASEPLSGKQSGKEKKSQKLLDSADQTCFSGGTDTEQLYRFALSYNRQNKNAWFGLLNCMRFSNRETEASAIENEMIALFGKSVVEPEQFAREFGTVAEISLKGTAASLVLETTSSKSRTYSDLFQIARRFSSTGTFSSLKILVKRPDGTGVLLTASPIGCISYPEFVKNSTFETFD